MPDNRIASASVYVLPRTVLVVTQHRTEAGFWIAGKPATRLERSVDATRLGAAVKQSLAASVAGLPTPRRDEHSSLFNSLLRELGFRSWRAVERDAQLCLVREASSLVHIVPAINCGTDGDSAGFREKAELEIRLGMPVSDEHLGVHILRALLSGSRLAAEAKILRCAAPNVSVATGAQAMR